MARCTHRGLVNPPVLAHVGPMHLHRVLIQPEDTDLMGRVQGPAVLKYFEQGRDHYFGLPDLTRLFGQTGIGFAVHRASMHHRGTATVGDRVVIRTSVAAQGEWRMACHQDMVMDTPAFTPVVSARLEMVCISRQLTLVAVPAWVRERVAQRGAPEAGTSHGAA